MQLTTLAKSGLGISREEITSLFEPFVVRHVNSDDRQWRSELKARKGKILQQYIKRRLLGWLPSNQRRENVVLKEYEKAWRASEYANYSLAGSPPRVSPWEWAGTRMFASDVGATRVRQLLLCRLIERVRPRRVLEVGCGNGINLLLLACRFPGIEFTGIELTEQGHRAATELQELSVLPEPMQDYAPLPLEDPAAFRRIRFVRGNAASLPFADGEIDLVLTVLALEQMEQIRRQALSEIARVAGRHTLLIEPFRDVNEHGWPRRNIIRRNYFVGRINDLPEFGLEPILLVDEFPQEVFLRACAVLAEKIG